jgi:hypothetical protein
LAVLRALSATEVMTWPAVLRFTNTATVAAPSSRSDSDTGKAANGHASMAAAAVEGLSTGADSVQHGRFSTHSTAASVAPGPTQATEPTHVVLLIPAHMR